LDQWFLEIFILNYKFRPISALGAGGSVPISDRGYVAKEMVIANDDLISALAETWDGTAGHAKALATIIRSLAVLKASG